MGESESLSEPHLRSRLSTTWALAWAITRTGS